MLEDPKFHSAADVIWTVKWVHEGAIRLASEMQMSKPELTERLKQEFHVSFTPTEGDLTTRIVSLIHSRMHRVRYLWPYQERAPTVIRDVDFAISKGEKVHVQRLNWRDPDRNDYVPAETFDTEPISISAATFAFDKSDFVRTSTGTVDFQNPMSDVAYKVVLERRSHESTISKVLAGSFIALFLLTGAGAAFDLRRRLLPRPAQPPRTFPQICRDMAGRLHRVWNEDSLTDADVLFCNRPRVEEQIEELKARGLVPASMGGITRLARGVTAGVGVPFVKAVLSGEISRSVELVIDQARVGDTMRLGALLDLLIRKQLMSGFAGRPLEWDALNESVRTNLPDAEGGDLLIRPEDETVVKIASRHFGQVLNDGMKHLSLLRGTWSVSKQDGRWVAQQRVELQGPLQVRGACLTTMLVEFNIPDEVERVDAARRRRWSAGCWARSCGTRSLMTRGFPSCGCTFAPWRCCWTRYRGSDGTADARGGVVGDADVSGSGAGSRPGHVATLGIRAWKTGRTPAGGCGVRHQPRRNRSGGAMVIHHDGPRSRVRQRAALARRARQRRERNGARRRVRLWLLAGVLRHLPAHRRRDGVGPGTQVESAGVPRLCVRAGDRLRVQRAVLSALSRAGALVVSRCGRDPAVRSVGLTVD